MAIVAWFVAAKIFGIYSQIIRYAGIRTVADIVAASFLHGVVLVVAVVALAIPGLPRTVSIIHVVLFTAAVISSRAIMRVIISDLLPTRSDRKSVVWGKSVSERVDLGGSGIIQKQKTLK